MLAKACAGKKTSLKAALSDQRVVVYTVGAFSLWGGGWLLGLYVQDEWKITKQLTLNVGIRFDQMYQFVEANQFKVVFHEYDWRLNDLTGGAPR